jgi:predicted nucleic acid-binding protein
MADFVLLDTSFFIRLLNPNDALFSHADGYFRYFIEHDMMMFVSTISIAEFCAGGEIDELPLKNIRILPFNLNHAKRAGKFAGVTFRNKGKIKLNARNIIPNDTKLFAQADCEASIKYYLSSDTESTKIYEFLKQNMDIRFQFIDLKKSHKDTFGVLF